MARARRRIASRGDDRRAADRRAANAVGCAAPRRCKVCDRGARARMDGRGLCSAAASARESRHARPRRSPRLQLRARPRRLLGAARSSCRRTARAGPGGGWGLPGACSIPRLGRLGQAHALGNRCRDSDAGLRRTWRRDRAPRHRSRPLAAVSRRSSPGRHRRRSMRAPPPTRSRTRRTRTNASATARSSPGCSWARAVPAASTAPRRERRCCRFASPAGSPIRRDATRSMRAATS